MSNTIVAVHSIETVTTLNEYGDVGCVGSYDNVYEFVGTVLPRDISKELEDGRLLWVTFYWKKDLPEVRDKVIEDDGLLF